MPNPKKSVKIHLGGRFHSLRYDFNALVALEDTLGIPISRWTDIISEQMGVRTIRTLVWAGLLHENEDITLKDVGEMLDISKLDDVSSKVLEAVDLAFAPQEKKDQGKAEGETEETTEKNGLGEST